MGDASRTTTSTPSLDEKVRFLERPEAYPDRPRRVRAVETHMSWVFLTDRHAYKLKKPIRYDVLDFSTLELRHRSCRRELRLNRRLAPHVYLDVVPLTVGPDGELQVAGEGGAVDWLVKMLRLPANRMLDEVIARGVARRADVEPAAMALARFYGSAAVTATIDAEGYHAHLREAILTDLDELRRPLYGLPVPVVRTVAEAQLQFLAEAEDTVRERVRAGRIVEGHGDLRPEHICLTDPPAIIDCLEFSRDLRILDPADELAFLALECDRLGARQVGEWFWDAYTGETGDAPSDGLVLFYRRFRALRRAKIAVWHLREPGEHEVAKWQDRAKWYLEDALVGLGSAQGG